ncbi:hypothetical protein A2906_01555 [Candidatus Nomurabacteria bacterium RIFCSPLOWO2_01_FULL_37_25]|nr:MAG: hypothetical protein A2640_01645 [Candidatus Nomurabacteria bacterium RIFCSPHIGHO2_01_FULL_36_23]OGI88222.1 MAG: hypothetical protein A2906_01555 [Candidatus Nomurabacteria bacterium RIFCSPLOWO2_01_FULL_37_25]
MANLGSEVSRAVREFQKEEYERMHSSIIRAKNIIQTIEQFPEMRGRTGELVILKSIIEDLDKKKLEIDKKQLLDYFSPFAIRLMTV